MRRLILLGLVAVTTLPAVAARRVTVAQLEEALAAENAARRGDLDVARQVGTFEMTERLTDATLNHFAATLKLGPRTALALQLLSDQSVFLDPPRDELPATGFPDEATQQKMLDAARAYAVQTWSRMPNFFVTRVTNRFDDAPHVAAKGDWPMDLGLQPVGSMSRQVTFRDGEEVQDATATGGDVKTPQELGLRSWGEFGPALTVVLGDLAQRTITFSHWEQTATGLAAVFTYAVPREASHYAVTFGYLSQTVIGRTQFGYSGRNREPNQVANIPKEKAYQTYDEKPGYHGTISIDPGTGAVMRLTIQAELSGADPLMLAETMVQYGRVTIGERQFICPVRSLAISIERGPGAGGSGSTMALNGVGDTSAWGGAVPRPGKSTVLLINETYFANYHRLGTTTRILTDEAGTGIASRASPNAGETGPAQNSAAASASEAPNANPQQRDTQVVANTPPPSPAAEAPAALPPAPPAEPVVPEVSMTPATGPPDQPTNMPQSADSGYSLKVTSRLVDVGLVAYDKKGHPVSDLKASDIEIYDNGQKQEIRSFNLATATAEHSQQAAVTPETVEKPELSFSNRAPEVVGAALVSSASEVGSTVLVIDESHIAWNDMNLTRAQILKFLNSLAPGERIGIYSMNGLGFHVLAEVTADHAALIAQMQKFMPKAQAVAEAQDEETRNRQQFDEVHNVADLNSVNGNHTDVADSSTPIDPQLMTIGDNPARSAFIILAQVARHLASIPGHKKVVWISSDNVLASWEDQAVGIEKSPKDVNGFAIRVQEAMNEAHAAVYPFDVSRLEGGAITADMQHRNVELTQAASDTATLGPGAAVPRNMTPGRISAEMSQDLHPVQGPVRQVAAATGGRVIRRSGDLAAQLNNIVADGHATYTLSFSPQTPPDGQYHTINIKLTGRRGLTLSYRTGYLFEKEPTTLKERFQAAVWRPTDASEIAVAASVSQANPGANVKVNIAAGDLGLQQQAGRWMDKLDIFFIQRDDAGLHAHIEGQTLGLRLKSATYERLLPTGVPFAHFVGVKPGTASLRVLVVDENSGRMGSVTIPVSELRAGQ